MKLKPRIKECPFCGGEVSLMSLTLPIRMFYCKNYKTCGAVVSFDNPTANKEKGDQHKIECWNRRVIG